MCPTRRGHWQSTKESKMAAICPHKQHFNVASYQNEEEHHCAERRKGDMLRDSCAYRALTFHLLLNGLMRQKHGCVTRDKTASFPLICWRQQLMNPTGLRSSSEPGPYLDGQSAAGGEHLGPCFGEHPLQPLLHHLGEPAGPRIVSGAHKLQN